MLRIKTKVGGENVHTLWYGGLWITIYTLNGKRESVGCPNLFEAGQMHLQMCRAVLKSQESAKRIDEMRSING